jgi:hypothetical protein
MSLLFRVVFPIGGVRDYSCGYRAYRAELLKKAVDAQDQRMIAADGFACMVDILLRLSREHAIFANDFCASAHPSDPAAADSDGDGLRSAVCQRGIFQIPIADTYNREQNRRTIRCWSNASKGHKKTSSRNSQENVVGTRGHSNKVPLCTIAVTFID